MKLKTNIVKEDDRYKVADDTSLNQLVVSTTKLFAKKRTTGHAHAGQEEVYVFTKGEGEMQIDNMRFKVKEGDVILIEDGQFHRVYNTSDYRLDFLCVFTGSRKK
ncbi:MAG: putative cupin domain protein [Prokaryotic dsDNA virus sp.]|nr:MAG: putative cupin domain protein [Prokaryotic dsDNA virus sp.]|tara:strand:- start:317 stop:631 length:315 start_codon:yes stop_codon:yes gene_type:complete